MNLNRLNILADSFDNPVESPKLRNSKKLSSINHACF